MTDHRAAFDASITFGNGGDLTVHDFRVDVPSPGVTEDEIAALFVASLGLLMTDAVELSNVRVFPEPHKGTRGGPSDRTAPAAFHGRILPLDTPATRLELPAGVAAPAALTGTAAGVVGPAAACGEGSTDVERVAVRGEAAVGPLGPATGRGEAAAGVVGLAAVCGERSAGVEHAAVREEVAVGMLGPVAGRGEAAAGVAGPAAACGETGAGGFGSAVVGGEGSGGVERAAAPAEPSAGSVTGRGEASAGEGEAAGIGPETVVGGDGPSVTREEAIDVLARTVELPAVVVRASGAGWETIGVGALAPFAVLGHAVLLQTQAGECLSEAAARWLVSQAVALVATDARTLGESRSLLLEAGIPVAESLTGLEALPPTGAYFTAVPPHAASGATPARAYARVP
ncbi:hypothetical protein [Nonomuraea ferruginea]|uniref:Uncharacterized protein n=1 Tax=Nonomuraea ferruginea TaxID=46174 RepID=A0ABT4T9R2_9ACTN|nr:hypothetical protein [Nonomuraea ferruginea]MDA0646024.1 hypothetical protein [Nonomuraea ferruginea]